MYTTRSVAIVIRCQHTTSLPLCHRRIPFHSIPSPICPALCPTPCVPSLCRCRCTTDALLGFQFPSLRRNSSSTPVCTVSPLPPGRFQFRLVAEACACHHARCQACGAPAQGTQDAARSTPGVCVWPVDDSSLSRLEAQIQGPDGTVYAKGVFKLEVEIPDRYPFEPPNVKFITPVYHPNIDSGGRICHDILNMPPKGQWRPSLNIGAVLASIRVLLEEPNHDDGLMSDISAEYKHNRALFDDKARQSTERYAMQNSPERNTVSCHDIDHAKAVASQSTPSKNQTLEKANEATLARPVLKEVNRMGASEVTLDELSTRIPGVAPPRLTQARPRQNLAAKLSLAKGGTLQAVRSCSLGVGGEPEPIISLNFSSEKERRRETGVSCGPGSQNTSQLGELHGPSIANAGKETVHIAENIITNNALLQSDEEKPETKAADNIERKQPAICSITKDQQPNTQTHTSQSSQWLSMPDKGKKLMLPKMKLLKLSRPQSLASQSVQESTETGRFLQGTSQVMGTAQISKEPVILLDSESDDEIFRVQARPQGMKRKLGRT